VYQRPFRFLVELLRDFLEALKRAGRWRRVEKSNCRQRRSVD
jgi:hypothetical protein|tara:strand:+ start:640 stop:765 length:126 start_codon:yes stop_codon:yes gene_type:complete